MKLKKIALLGLSLISMFASIAQTVTNGSVTGAPAANSGINGGNAAGWSGCGFSPDLCDVGFPSYSGNSNVAPSPSPDGGTWLGMASLDECAQTTITGLTAGTTYTLCFYGACFGSGTSIFNGGPAQPTITIGGTSQSFVIPQAANTWTLYTMTFTATAGTMTLQCVAPNVSASVWSSPAAFYVALDGFTISTPGGSATWTNPSPLCSSQAPINLDALVTGTAGGVWSGTGVSGSTFNPGVGTQSVTYTVNPGSCNEVVSTQTITVTAGSNGSWTIPTNLCDNDAPINLNTFITGDAGGTWSGTGVSGTMFDPAVGTQSITYSVGTAPCDDVVTQTITVGTFGNASWTPPTGLCTSSALVDLSTLVTGTAGGTWSGTGVSGNMFDPAAGTQSVTYSAGTAPCNATSTQTITVGAQADASWTIPTGLCNSGAPIDLNTFITGTTGGSWSGTGVTGSMFDPASGTQSITYQVGTAPCDNSLTQTITVGTTTTATWTPPSGLCTSSALVDLSTLVTGTAGGTWSGTGVSGSMFDPSVGTQSVTYTVGTAPCDASSTQTITVGAQADASWTIPTGLCNSGTPIDLNTFITGTTGGTWSGTGITGSMFDPSVGTQSITYAVGSAPCDNSLTQTINVGTITTATWTPPAGVCTSSAAINLNTLVTGTAGGTWSGTGVTGNMFDPSVGTQSITYAVGTAPCDASSTQTITVTTQADAAWTPATGVCDGDAAIDLNTLITGTAGGTWSGTGVTGSMFDPSVGTQSLTYTVGTAPCDASSTQAISVDVTGDATWTPPAGVCQSDSPIDLNTLSVNMSGGTWSGTGVTGNMFDPSSGTQSITYTVGTGGCQDAITQNIDVTPTPDPSWTTTMLCTSSAPVNLNNQITGDTGGTWSGTGVSGNVFDPFFGTQSVTYTVTAGSCSATSTQTITVYNPVATITSTQASCFGATDGQATVSVSGGSGNYTYSWNSTLPQTSTTASGLASGTYIVTVTDVDGGCTVQESVTIIEPAEILLTMTAQNACYPDLGSATVAATGGVGGFSYNWSPVSSTTATATGIDSAMATVIVTDANGCTATDSIFVNVWDAPIIEISNDTTIHYGDEAQLIASGGVSYSWTPDEDLSCSDCPNPIANPIQDTYYCVTAQDANGCVSTECMTMFVEIVCGDVFVPSAFSPNNDGENDVLCVYSDCIKTMTFTIYNRWGERVYETNNMNICWDGTWKGKALNSAVFVYVLDGYLINGEPVNQKGNISLIR
ncbi:gliding motility-associated C-terminal domain-containing protein [Paracrocinitomix mangrovi]|uniref:T9SS type B sorting domain-containing protein n=1 Tax=Paracrocinitomix mangrovi TaxID=2862509 RepID=UPI001C8D1AC5|nr:gliding motility-associated C-terminal domain-containing protein [Paracrocinitomix mangrovi]UKN03392.1 gliding motility-associated C-terminal domain-containing protein [Paracrocinitomix mangrovi]